MIEELNGLAGKEINNFENICKYLNTDKDNKISTTNTINNSTGNYMSINPDKITINEYCLSIEFKSPGIINSKGWGYAPDERDLKKIEKAKEKKEQWQLDEEALEKKEKEEAENQTPPAGEKTPE